MARSTSVESALARFAFDHASLLVLVLDREGRVQEANRFAQSLTGGLVPGSSFADLLVDFSSSFDLEHAVAAREAMLLDVTTNQGPPQTLQFHFADCGDALLVIGEPAHQENASLHSTLITLNAQIGNLNRELQKKTSQLERANELKNRFIGMAAHDLRNPIGGIHELAAILRRRAEEAGDGSNLEIFAAMRESSGFMLGLIDDLLTAITIESGEMRLSRESTDLNELVSSIVRLNRVLSDRKGVRLALEQESLPELFVDPMKLRQVLNNVISNAVKFSSSGSSVTTHVVRDGARVAISVSDTGPGIPTEELHKLFKPFSRTTVTAPDGEKGSGLGLSIAKRIVEAHGGTVRVESEVGAGTTFHVSLPLVAEIER